ncbi:MAG: glycosidase, partial [Clostridia bacterium]|nr:glycosidase [Clostridia bacterium]
MAKIIGKAIPNLPWQDKPAGYTDPVWRYTNNPIIGRNGNKRSNSVFNSAVVPFKDGFAGVFRCDSRSISMDLFAGWSDNGIDWKIEDESLNLVGADPEIAPNQYRYDARIIPLEGKYYVTWCNGYHGPTIGVAWTEDFKTFHQLENAFLPYNRNGVLFPRKIGGKFAMLSRPSDTGHTAFGDIFYSESPDMEYWG